MKKVVNIRGGKGSGKSTSIYEYLKAQGYTHDEIVVDGKKLPIEICSGGVALGRYTGKKCEGMDIVGTAQLLPLLSEVFKMLQPQWVLYESAFLSYDFKRYVIAQRLAKLYRYKFIALTLEVDYEKRIERLNGRKGSPVKTQMIQEGLKYVKRCDKRLQKSGITVIHKNVTDFQKTDYVDLLDKIIKM